MTWTSDQRDKLTNRLREIGDILFSPDARELDDDAAIALEAEEQALLLEYAENMPHVAVSRCPICQEELKIAMDLRGLDGPWWWAVRPVDVPRHHACEHFQVHQGAMNFGTRMPVEVTETVRVGPGAPFVIDRLLEMDGVTAVVSGLKTEHGDQIFLMAYFAENPIPDTELHQEWLQESYTQLDADGEPEFAETKFDPWDFDLQPWFDSGKLQWIDPGDPDLALHTGTPNPYLGIEGTQMSQVIVEGELELAEAPYGQENTMYERP